MASEGDPNPQTSGTDDTPVQHRARLLVAFERPPRSGL